MLTPILELQARPCYEVFHRARDEYFARWGCGHDTCRNVDRDPSDGTADHLDLSRMTPSPDIDSEASQTCSDCHGTPHGAGRSVEGCKETVSRRIDLATSETIELSPHGVMMRVEELGPPVDPPNLLHVRSSPRYR